MAAATISSRIQTADPTKEVVVLEVTDGETFVSERFDTLVAGIATLNVDSAALTIPIGLAFSGGTVTIHGTGLSNHAVCLQLYGHLR